MGKFDWRYYYDENGEWTKEDIDEYRDRTETPEDKIGELKRLFHLHRDLNQQGEGWSEILKQTRWKLSRALEDKWMEGNS